MVNASQVPCDGAEALEQAAQRICACTWISGSVLGQAGQGLEQHGTVEDVGVGTGGPLKSLPTQAIP